MAVRPDLGAGRRRVAGDARRPRARGVRGARRRARDHDIAIVTHVSPIKAAVAWALGCGVEIAWRSHLSHASVCRIDMRRTGPVLFTFNETC